MADPTPPPLSGDAAYRAQKEQIAKRNDAAQARAAAQRTAKDARRVDQQMAAARHEASNLPEQPRP